MHQLRSSNVDFLGGGGGGGVIGSGLDQTASSPLAPMTTLNAAAVAAEEQLRVRDLRDRLDLAEKFITISTSKVSFPSCLAVSAGLKPKKSLLFSSLSLSSLLRFLFFFTTGKLQRLEGGRPELIDGAQRERSAAAIRSGAPLNATTASVDDDDENFT